MDSEQVTPIVETTAETEQTQAVLYATGFNDLVSAGQTLIDGCHAVSMEMLAFWQSRLKEDIATGQRLLECRSVESALDVQLDFARAALQAYVDQSVRIGDLVSRSLARMCGSGLPTTAQLSALAA